MTVGMTVAKVVVASSYCCTVVRGGQKIALLFYIPYIIDSIICMKGYPLLTILWNDAAYSFETEMPKTFPNPRLTVGFLISENEEQIFIATNVNYDAKTEIITPIDGFVIPKGTIIEKREIMKQ